MKFLFLFAFILVLVIVSGCQSQNCPVQECPECPKCNLEPEVNNTIPEIKNYAEVSFIDVKHGDSILLQAGDQDVLVDCGKNAQGANVVEYLENNGVAILDYLILTHIDSEHIGGCDDVLKYIPVNTVIYNGKEESTYLMSDIKANLGDAQMIEVKQDRKFFIGEGELEVLHSSKDMEGDNNSIVTMFSYGTNNVLLMSDCGELCEEKIINDGLTADILKVAEHGSRFSTSVGFIESVKPNIAIISTGINDYGHPDQKLLDRFEQESILTYRTDVYGTIKLHLYKDKYEVQ